MCSGRSSRIAFGAVAIDAHTGSLAWHMLQRVDTISSTCAKVAACGSAPDVTAFAKLPPQFSFAIEYTDSAASLRYYEPDFAAVLADGSHQLIETKGRDDSDVAHKDRAARLWCDNASQLTTKKWSYVKVPQAGFDKLQPTSLADLLVFEE